MTLFLNDLSFRGMIATTDEVIEELVQLYALSTKAQPFLISRAFPGRPATPNDTVYQAIAAASSARKGLLLNWISRSGPFLDDDSWGVEDDLWWHADDEVTYQGLGEASRRILGNAAAASFSSSKGCGAEFDKEEVSVTQGLPDEPIRTLAVPNHWKADKAIAHAEALRGEPDSWGAFVAESIRKFPSLQIDEQNLMQGLAPHPFSGNVVRRGFALLSILNDVAAGVGPDGSLSKEAMGLITEHFQGDRARFSDENPSDPQVFTFVDHNDGGKPIYCSWHGKVQTPPFRLHFQWPVPAGQRYIKVLYYGYKLTKW